MSTSNYKTWEDGFVTKGFNKSEQHIQLVMTGDLVNSDISKVSNHDLLNEYEKCMAIWGKYSCDCFGYYISALHREITKRGGWPAG
ncbi:MAG: hypothetical protein HC831_13455 [Chloroflexia bacterium]|nr:hypothetical protein [Chloroflexia bacterium]